MPFLLAHWRALGALAIVLVLAGYIETLRLEVRHYEKKYDDEHRAFVTFKAETKALGEKAKADALAKEAADKKRKDDADAENATALATLADSVGKLRNERDRARSRILSATATSPGSPDVLTFDRPVVERAYGELIAGLRGLADEGSKATVDLDSAKRWASGRERGP